MKCEALKGDGAQCRANAVAGSPSGGRFCAYHQQKAFSPVSEASAGPTVPSGGDGPGGGDPVTGEVTGEDGGEMVQVRTDNERFRIRFLGSGSYGLMKERITLHQGDYAEVDRETRDRLLEQEPDVFEEA